MSATLDAGNLASHEAQSVDVVHEIEQHRASARLGAPSWVRQVGRKSSSGLRNISRRLMLTSGPQLTIRDDLSGRDDDGAVTAVMAHQDRGPDRGRIVVMSSLQAKEGTAMSGPYAASKAGLIALTKCLGKELAADGILVNAITPTAVRTAMETQLTPQHRADLLSLIPLGRFPSIEAVGMRPGLAGCGAPNQD